MPGDSHQVRKGRRRTRGGRGNSGAFPTSDDGQGAKYGNQKVRSDGYTFDSLKEARRYEELKLLRRAGLITSLQIHPRWGFQHPVTKEWLKSRTKHYPNGRKLTYAADFSYVNEHGLLVVEDTKGYDTSESRLRRALMELFYQIRVEVLRCTEQQ